MQPDLSAPATAHLGGVLLEHAARLAALWPSLVGPDDGVGPVPAEDAAAFVAILAEALDPGDLSRLAALGRLDGSAGTERRLGALLAAVDAVRRAAVSSGVADPAEAADGMALVCRRLAVRTAAVLTARAVEGEAAAAAASGAVGVTVHELRRPLTIMSSYSQLLAGDALGELPPRIGGAVDAVSTATETMMRLVESLAAVARLEDPADAPLRRRVPVSEVVQAAVAEVATEAGLRGVAIDTAIDSDPVVDGDVERLVLAVTNLLSNAVKHAPRDSSVSVRAVAGEDTVRISVRDHGPGFPPESAPRLFEKYYRAAGERESGLPGTGLGLFIVRTVAERHGGRVTARLPEDGGAEFVLSLPRLD